MKKLSIIIPHYQETIDIIKPLLDSIELQQNIDFSNIEVIISEDLKAKDLDITLLNYSFLIKQTKADIAGVSAARNAGLDSSSGEYIMFCDADDLFYNACGLWIVFNEIENNGFDALISTFIEETRDSLKRVLYINHELDSTFVHGKVYRKEYLIKNNIRWNNKLTIHEDSYFNILCQNLSQNVKYCPTSFYLWKWRDESVCRHDKKYILKTYKNLIDSNDALIDEFIKRGVLDKASLFVGTLIFDSYYTMNKPEWINQENKEYRDSTEKRFAKYYLKRKKLWDNLTSQEKILISNQIRTRIISEGMMMEAVTIDDWLSHIESLN